MDAGELHARATEEFGKRVAAIGEGQWGDPTPCTEWDVRALLNHLTGEQAWIPPLVTEGLTVPDVGTRFDGDILGDDPKAAWETAAKEAVASFGAGGALTKAVHLSGRDVPGERYAHEVFCDLVVHSWDLAKGIGKYEEIDPELLQACWDIGTPMVDEWRKYGVYGDNLEPADDDLQTRLLAYYGRRRDWMP
jgi:uncharacterized protein (TIGR03086 family)